MAHLFGIRSAGSGGDAPPFIPASYYAHRRSDDYHFGFILPIPLFNIGPSAPPYSTTTFVENENESGKVRCDYAASIASVDTNVLASPYSNNFIPWALVSGNIETNDPRVTYNLDISVTTADFLPDIPANRWESDQLFIDANLPGYGGRFTWQFKTPLPLTAGFAFDGTTYTTWGMVSRRDADFYGTLPPSSSDTNGRFIHLDPSYFPGGVGGYCAVHGTNFATFAEEVAHNSLSFQLAGGDASHTFETTQSIAAFSADTTEGELPYSSNSEVAGAHSGRAFYPSIVRATAEFVEPNRLRVDTTNTLSPTANVLGVVVRDTSTPAGRPAPSPNGLGRYLVDHYEVDGVSYSVDQGGTGGPYIDTDYIPARVFDIVFKESDEEAARTVYLELRVVVDADALPPTGDTLKLNYMMSIQALLFATLNGTTPRATFIVRPSNEIKKRNKSTLWQHKGHARIWAMETGSGKGDVLTSDDEGATYQIMANAWSDISGAVPLFGDSFGDGGALSIAKVGSNVQFRSSVDGSHWSELSTVGPYAAGAWCAREHKGSEMATVTVDGPTAQYRSSNAGEGADAEWQETT